jgi:flagellar hook-length control protein FliK
LTNARADKSVAEEPSPQDSRAKRPSTFANSALDELMARLNALGNPGVASSDPLSRRGAILSFMGRMQTEMNVGPVRFLEAFGQLSTEELGLPPEATVDRVIDQLGLPPQHETKAKAYYLEMLQKTDAKQVADYLQGGDRQISLELLSQNELRQQKIDRGLQKMQSSFFVRTEATPDPSAALPPNDPMLGKDLNQKADDFAGLAVLGGAAMVEESAIDPVVQPTVDDHLIDLSEALDKLGESFADPVLAVEKSAEAVTTSASPDVLDIDALIGKMKIDSQPGSPISSNPSVALNADTTRSEGDSASSNSGGDSPNRDASASFSLTSAPGTSAALKGSPAATFAIDVRPSAEEQQQNIQQIVGQSQQLIKKGGGEMKLRLAPEGLGELHIKVAMGDGQIQVEMLTESDTTKKLLEKSIADLKSSLQAHKIELGPVKVDISQNITQDLMNQQQDAERRFAQNFLGQFREQNQAFREGLMGSAGGRVYRGQQDSGAPIDPTLAAQRQNANARRLDLVA